MTLNDLAVKVLPGIISGIISVIFWEAWRRLRLWRAFKKYAGPYSVYPSSSNDPTGETVDIRYLKGRILEVVCRKGPVVWVGVIAMSEQLPEYGTGIYRYPDGSWGEHTLLYDAESQCLRVFGVNRSHPGKYEPFAYKLKKEAVGLSHRTT